MVNNTDRNTLKLAFSKDLNYNFAAVEKLLNDLGFEIVSTRSSIKDSAVFGAVEKQ